MEVISFPCFHQFFLSINKRRCWEFNFESPNNVSAMSREYFCMSHVSAASYSPFTLLSYVHNPQEIPPAYTQPGMYFSWTSAFYLGSFQTFSSLIKFCLSLFPFSLVSAFHTVLCFLGNIFLFYQKQVVSELEDHIVQLLSQSQQIFLQQWQGKSSVGKNSVSGHKTDVLSAFYKLCDFGQIT